MCGIPSKEEQTWKKEHYMALGSDRAIRSF